MGSSQNGMRSLETRVHGLELALDEISFDLAMSTGRMSKGGSTARSTCCILPGAAEFFSSKLWRKTEGRRSAASALPFAGSSRTQALNNVASRNLAPESSSSSFLPANKSSRIQGGHAVIVNPLAKIPSDSQHQGISDISSSRMVKNVQIAV